MNEEMLFNSGLASDQEAVKIANWLRATKPDSQKDREKFVDYYIRAPMLSRPPRIQGFFENENRIFSSKYDTTPDMVSSDTANNFSLGILPSGISSIKVRYENLRSLPTNIQANLDIISAQETIESKVLHKALTGMQFLTGMHQISKEYLDFGYVLVILEKTNNGGYSLKIPPAIDSYIYKDLKNNLFAASFEERYPFFVAKALYPKMQASNQITNSWATITRMFFNYEMLVCFKMSHTNLYDSILQDQNLSQVLRNAEQGPDAIAGTKRPAGMFEVVLYNNLVVELKYSSHPNVFAASARHLEGYSSGYGINAAGAIWLLNWTVGWSIFGVQKIANPAYLTKHDTEIVTPEGHTGIIDQTPGANNTIKTGEGQEVPIGEAVQPTSNIPMDLERLTQMNSLGELKLEKAYQTGVYNLQGPAPNETATAFSGRLAQAVRSFRSVSDSFMQQLFLPLIATINHLVNKENIALFAQGIMEAAPDINTNVLTSVITTNSYVEKGEHEEKVMNFRLKTELLMMVMQLKANQVPTEGLEKDLSELFP